MRVLGCGCEIGGCDTESPLLTRAVGIFWHLWKKTDRFVTAHPKPMGEPRGVVGKPMKAPEIWEASLVFSRQLSRSLKSTSADNCCGTSTGARWGSR